MGPFCSRVSNALWWSLVQAVVTGRQAGGSASKSERHRCAATTNHTVNATLSNQVRCRYRVLESNSISASLAPEDDRTTTWLVVSTVADGAHGPSFLEPISWSGTRLRMMLTFCN
jgi:hypothetical protein